MNPSRKIFFTILFLSVMSFFSILFFKANPESFRPPDGTTSVYRWDFTGFDMIGALNETHIDHNDLDSAASFDVVNPTYAEFSVTYTTLGEWLEESIDGRVYNASHSFRFMPSYLIDTTNRSYVNEEGDVSESTTPGYIDPNNINIGMQIQIESNVFDVTAQEDLDIADTTREAWKLEYISEYYNMTAYYDTETGIMLKYYIETTVGIIGGMRKSPDSFREKISQIHQEEKSTRIQILISTNAWEKDEDGLIPFTEPIIPLIGLVILSITQKIKRK